MKVLPLFFPIDPVGTRSVKNTRGLIEERESPLTIREIIKKDTQTVVLGFEECPGFRYESCYFREIPNSTQAAL